MGARLFRISPHFLNLPGLDVARTSEVDVSPPLAGGNRLYRRSPRAWHPRSRWEMSNTSSKGEKKMRIFCPEHGKGFFAPRQNPVRCENRGHTMGELDFEGEARNPAEARWEYCCNCAHFFLFGSSADGIERCPACARQLFARYVCNRCYVMTCESNTPPKRRISLFHQKDCRALLAPDVYSLRLMRCANMIA